MPNMSYCRFRNTLSDFRDCLYALQEEGLNSLSNDEKQAALNLMDLARDMVDEFENGDYDFEYHDNEEDDY